MKIANINDSHPWFQVLQTGEHSQTAVMTLAPGASSSKQANSHEKSDQVLLVVEGELRAEIGSETKMLKKGDVCLIPAGTLHRFENVSGASALTFNVYSPPEYPAES